MILRIIISIFILGVICSMTSCDLLDSDNDLTIVKGKVSDSITGDNIEGIPIELLKCSGGFFQLPICDSIKAVYTNSEGGYEFSFRTERRFYYKVGIARNINYKSTDTHYYGATVNEGKTNEINFQTIPYRVLEVHLTIDKNDKNFLKLDYNPWGCSLGGYGGTLFMDTVRTNQLIDTVRYLRVFPMCDYGFLLNLCNRSGVMIQDYVYADCNDTYAEPKIFYVNNIDTTKINLDW